MNIEELVTAFKTIAILQLIQLGLFMGLLIMLGLKDATNQESTKHDATKDVEPSPLATYQGLRSPDQPDTRWHRIEEGPLPIQIEIDLKIKEHEGTRIVKKARMVSKRPLKFRPDFLKYKQIIAWKFTE